MEGVFYAKAAAVFGATVAMGMSTFGPPIGQGMIGAKGIENIGKFPEHATQIRNAMMLAMAMVETSAVLMFTISILTLMRNS